MENDQLGAWVGTKQGEKPAVLLDIQRQPGANIIQTVDRVKQLLPKLTGTLPPSVHVSILADRTETIRASVSDVQFTLLLTVALVVMVMFLFLRKLWATVITSVALPLSLIGTFGIMYLAGFSLDNLSLMALTISTGFVVDDAIVMIENIVRYIEAGDSPMEAALKGARQIGFTVVSLSVSLIAVFIPLLFMTGIVGRLFREFAITMSRRGRRLGVRLSHAHADDVREIAPRRRRTKIARLKTVSCARRKIISSASAIYTNAACAG